MYGDASHVRQQAVTAMTRRRLFSTAHTPRPCVFPWYHVILHAIHLHERGKKLRDVSYDLFPIAQGIAEYNSSTHPASCVPYRMPFYRTHVLCTPRTVIGAVLQEVLSLQPMIPPKRFDIVLSDWGVLRRSRCVQILHHSPSIEGPCTGHALKTQIAGFAYVTRVM